MMRLDADMYALTSFTTRPLARMVPNAFGEGVDPDAPLGAVALGQVQQETMSKFMNMDLFFVKVGGNVLTELNE
jgi:hypothetical protein